MFSKSWQTSQNHTSRSHSIKKIISFIQNIEADIAWFRYFSVLGLFTCSVWYSAPPIPYQSKSRTKSTRQSAQQSAIWYCNETTPKGAKEKQNIIALDIAILPRRTAILRKWKKMASVWVICEKIITNNQILARNEQKFWKLLNIWQ